MRVMKTVELTVTRIGKERGVKLPSATLRRYHIGSTVLMEERAEEIVLRPKPGTKLSWVDTAKAMAAAKEDWSGWETTLADGLDEQ